jgi:hypothetical protein
MLADSRRELIRKLQAQGLPSSEAPLPVVSLEDFFLGNSDYGSIGCNLSNNPGPQVFFKSRPSATMIPSRKFSLK